MRTADRTARERPPQGEPLPQVADWRTSAERSADQELTGTWWRCREHGLTQSPTLLGFVPYCPQDGCTAHLLLARSAGKDGMSSFEHPREVLDVPRARPRDFRARGRVARPEIATGTAEAIADRARACVGTSVPDPTENASNSEGTQATPPAAVALEISSGAARWGTTDLPCYGCDDAGAAPRIVAAGVAICVGCLERALALAGGVIRPVAPPQVPAAPPPRAKPDVTGAERPADVVAGAWDWPYVCDVCDRRGRAGEDRVALDAGDIVLALCPVCAADGDQETRAAAAPLLRDLVLRLRRRRA